MEAKQTNGLPARKRWAIDHRLEQVVGRDVRVAVDAFSPVLWNGDAIPVLSPVRNLILPDNSQAGGLPVFFEGRLRRFERQIAVVFVGLDAPTSAAASTEGIVTLRGRPVVILRGPATVSLAFPFRVEAIPTDPDNYWEDLRFPTAQFRLQLA